MNSQPEREHDLERGATAVEYGLLIALIAGVIIATVITLGLKVITLYSAPF